MKKIFSLLILLTAFSFIAVSCGDNENADNHIYDQQIKLISLISDKYNVVLNDDVTAQELVTFMVTNNSGVNLTVNSEIFVNEIAIETNVFTPTELGSFEVYAKYTDEESGKQFLSDKKIVNVIEDTSNLYFRHKVLIEDFTGTWCGWCTRIIYAIEQVQAQTQNAIAVGIHNDDPFDFPGRMPLEDYLQVEGAYPFATINRKTMWKHPQHHFVNQPIDLILPESPIGIKINSSLGATSGTVDVSFSFKEDIQGDLRYVVYVVENGLIADQTNYNTDLYNGVPVLTGFNHDHVLRGVYGNILGNDLGQPATAGAEVTLSGLTVNYSSENMDKLQVIAFIINAQGKALNVQIAHANTEKDYEFAQ